MKKGNDIEIVRLTDFEELKSGFTRTVYGKAAAASTVAGAERQLAEGDCHAVDAG